MRFASRKKGWIGVDLGTSTVKIAQVVRTGKGLRLAASSIVARDSVWPNDLRQAKDSISSMDEILAACSLEDRLSGRRAAGILPMSMCDIHLIDKPLDASTKSQHVIRQEIETATQQSAEAVQFDYWSAPASEKKPGWTQALAVGRNWTEQLASDVTRSGWSCEAIDGLPLAMSRAVNLVHPQANSVPLAALDWGYSRATICFIENGQPAYVRCLKDCGFGSLLDDVVSGLGISAGEAQEVLEDYGLATSDSGTARELNELLHEIVGLHIMKLVEEIRRSTSHYQYLRRAKSPERLYLLGGGATVREIGPWLTKELYIDSQVWRISAEQPNSPVRSSLSADCLFAPAIALSALAWRQA